MNGREPVEVEPGDRVSIVNLDGQPVEHDGFGILRPWFADAPVTIIIDDGHVSHGPATYWSKDDGIDPETGGRRYKMLPMERS